MNSDFVQKRCHFSFIGILVSFFVLFFCSTDCFGMGVPPYVSRDAWGRYTSSWYAVQTEASKHFELHSKFGRVIAETKLVREPDKPDNIAAFGFTLRSGVNGVPIKSIIILPFVCSTIDQIKDPIICSDSRSAVTVRDLLGEDIIHKKHRAHKVLEMAEWLAPWEYTKNWGMSDLITYERELISKGSQQNPTKEDLTRLTILKPVDTKIGKAAGDIFHCEQVVIYKLLTDSEFLSGVISELMEGMIDLLPPRICLDFDIITFNDMCPKCFSTAFFRFDEMKLEISKQLSLYFQSAQKTELLSQKFPIIFRILVSSSRPYKIETADKDVNLKTRECEDCREDQTGPCSLVKTLVSKHVPHNGEIYKEIPLENGVFQFVNPWIDACLSPMKKKYQAILDKEQQLNTAKAQLAMLTTNTENLQQEIQRVLQQQVPSALASMKNLSSFNIDTLDALLKLCML